MSYKFLSIENKAATLKSGATVTYAIVTLNNPPMNALASGVFHDLDAAITSLESAQTRVAIVTGAGKAFVAGADISEMNGMDATQAKEYSLLGHRIFSRMETSPVIFIAAVNGFALGGGLELAMAADIRIFADAAQVGLPEPTLGLIPGFGGTQRLQRLVGQSHATYLSLTSERISAQEALRIGLAAKVTSAESLMPECEAVAQKILASGPQAIRALKHTILSGADKPMPQALEFEVHEFSQLFAGSEVHEGLKAFLEKRPAKF
ncbi:MAG: enoyl-CoA hydratase-related protein [Turneriella sp.]